MDWRAHVKVSIATLAGVALLWVAFVLGRRVPLLSMFDLGIHELGHLITRPFGMVVSFVMGSGLQILVPFGLAGYFWFWQRDRVSTGLLMCWGATAMQDVSVYIADAPYRSLQLIGGTHDWWWLLSRRAHLDWADELSRGVWVAGLLLGLAGLGIIVAGPIREWWTAAGRGPAIRVPGPVAVRRPRPPSQGAS
ncbi:MAG: hypothetical protein HKO82_08365 [Acidimicrobiia bacterium]|nr:hypothetical protein [Acidimicrobiia bacterium]